MRAFRVALAGLLVVFAVYYLLAAPDRSDSAPAPGPAVSEEPLKLLHWQFEGRFCADNWGGASVQEQGDCSGHGGPVTRWHDKSGTVITCTKAPPLSNLKRDESIRLYGRIVC